MSGHGAQDGASEDMVGEMAGDSTCAVDATFGDGGSERARALYHGTATSFMTMQVVHEM